MNLAEIRDELQAHGYANDTEDAQTTLINAVYRDVLLERRWPWLRRQATVPLPAQASSADLLLIADLRDVDAIHIEGFEDPVFIEVENFRAYRYADNRSRGRPQAWTLTPDRIEVWPSADRDYELVVDYIAAAPRLVSEFDVPVIPEQHHDVLVYGAAARMAIRERDTDQRQLMAAEYERALARLRAASNVRQRQSSAQVKSSGMYDSAIQYWGWRG